MSKNISVREANESDGEKVWNIAFPIMQSYGLFPDPNEIDFELGHFGQSYPGAVTQRVACFDGEVIGSIVLCEKKPEILKLTGFYVSSKHRGLGAGRMLLESAIQDARKKCFKAIYLETVSSMKEAIYLYESFGWKPCPREPSASGADIGYILDLVSDNNSVDGSGDL